MPCWSQQNYALSFGSLNQNQFFVRNPFAPATTTRVVGRKESQIALGQIAPKQTKKPTTAADKRFGSLEIKKHRCYSPTFYSLRCKKHAKKRPVVYAIPKKLKGQVAPFVGEDPKPNNLSDSVQIFELNESPPKPVPRSRKPKVSKTLDDSSESCSHEVSTTEAVIHEEISSPNKSATKASSVVSKDSPTVMVRPSFVKPKVESPKGALSLQIQAKLKRTDSPPTPTDDANPSSSVPEMPILDKWNTNKLNPNQVCFFFFVFFLLLA